MAIALTATAVGGLIAKALVFVAKQIAVAVTIDVVADTITAKIVADKARSAGRIALSDVGREMSNVAAQIREQYSAAVESITLQKSIASPIAIELYVDPVLEQMDTSYAESLEALRNIETQAKLEILKVMKGVIQ